MNSWSVIRAVAVAGAFVVTVGIAAADPGQVQQPDQSQQNQTPPPPQPATPPKDPMDEVVCKKEEATTGSRLGARKVCKTRREWKQIQDDARRMMQDADQASGTNNPTSGGGS